MIKDSGERTEFSTGAVRDMHEGKGRMDLLPLTAIIELSKHCEEGALKYGEHNIDKGIPQHSLCDSAMRHLAKYMRGDKDENHLRAACWNLMFALQQEVERQDLQDIPSRQKVEMWKDIDGSNFEVSNLGRVRNKKNGRITVGTQNEKGYLRVSVYIDGKTKSMKVHRLVAKAFIPNPNEFPEVNHKNGDKTDNRVYNLEWVTHEQNVKHAFAKGLADDRNKKITDEQIEYIRKNCIKGDKEFGVRAIARKLGLSHTTVKDVLNNKRWKNSR